MSGTRSHWEQIYAPSGQPRSWYQNQAQPSLSIIESLEPLWGEATSEDTPIEVVDIGGGSSPLAQQLAHQGQYRVTVVDISESPLERARTMAKSVGHAITWVQSDLRELELAGPADVWHDRAVLHFMTATEDQASYRSQLLRLTRPGSFVVIGVFSESGPTRCSGLTVQRYGSDDIGRIFGHDFELRDTFLNDHQTPAGATQSFRWFVGRRLSARGSVRDSETADSFDVL